MSEFRTFIGEAKKTDAVELTEITSPIEQNLIDILDKNPSSYIAYSGIELHKLIVDVMIKEGFEFLRKTREYKKLHQFKEGNLTFRLHHVAYDRRSQSIYCQMYVSISMSGAGQGLNVNDILTIENHKGHLTEGSLPTSSSTVIGINRILNRQTGLRDLFSQQKW